MRRTVRRLVPIVALLVLALLFDAGPSASAASMRPYSRLTATVGTNFEGVPNLNSLASPSDSTGAAGPDFLLGAVNVHLDVLDRSGTVMAGPLRLSKLFNNLPMGTDTDPKVVYDQYGDHFVLTYLLYNNNESYIVVVTIPEATADLKSTWCHWIYVGDQISGDGHQFADYPGLGYTAGRVTITTNNFPFTGSGYDYAQILSFKKSQLYDPNCAGTPTPKVFGGNKTDEPDGSVAFTIRPAETIGGSSPKTQYLTSFDYNGAQTDDIVLWRLRPVHRKLKLTSTAIPVGQVSVPPYGHQCGGTSSNNTKWDTGDTRLINAFYDVDTGYIYTAHTVGHQFGAGPMESANAWYEIQPQATLTGSTITRSGYVGRDGYDAGWPSVATNANGVLFINYDEASDANDECISSVATTVEPGQTVSTGETLIKAGDTRYEFGPGVERWGDYTAINRDPGDGTGATMVAFNSYAYDSSPPSSTTFLWDEWIAYLTDA